MALPGSWALLSGATWWSRRSYITSAFESRKGELLKLREALIRAFRRAVSKSNAQDFVGVPWVEVLELMGLEVKIEKIPGLMKDGTC